MRFRINVDKVQKCDTEPQCFCEGRNSPLANPAIVSRILPTLSAGYRRVIPPLGSFAPRVPGWFLGRFLGEGWPKTGSTKAKRPGA